MKKIHPLNVDPDDIFNFWLNVNKTDTCWNWACRSNAFRLRNRDLIAPARFSYILSTGQDPEDLKVFRTCNNEKCIRPEHLQVGDQSDLNVQTSLKSKSRPRRNGVRIDSSSGYYGVSYDKRDNIYQAQVHRDPNNRISLGRYKNPEEAALVVNDYIKLNNLPIPLNIVPDDKMQELGVELRSRKVNEIATTRRTLDRVPDIRNYSRGPEAKIQDKIISFLRVRGWVVIHLTGNLYQKGMPDLFCCHKKYGIRLVEVKYGPKHSFTSAQIQFFPQLISNGAPVYVLVGADEENYKRLFKQSNLWEYLLGVHKEKLNQ